MYGYKELLAYHLSVVDGCRAALSKGNVNLARGVEGSRKWLEA